MKILITGGAGFIGANLCRTLAADPAIDEVVAYGDLSSGMADNLVDGVRLVQADINDGIALRRELTGASAVVHLTARPSVPRSIEDPVASHVANTVGTMEVLEAARHIGGVQLIVASSSSVYGANPELPKHEGLKPSPVCPYAATKLATETYALAWAASFGLEVLAFRFFNVFGPLQPAGHAYVDVVPTFIDAALDSRPLPIHGDGEQSRDFTYVGTLCEVITEAIRRRVSHPEPVNLAFGSRTTLLEVANLLERMLCRPSSVSNWHRGRATSATAWPTRPVSGRCSPKSKQRRSRVGCAPLSIGSSIKPCGTRDREDARARCLLDRAFVG